MPTGAFSTTGTPAATSTSSGPTPDSINRCAEPIAPAHNTIRSADSWTGPSGPTQSAPTATPRSNLIRSTRVSAINVRLGRSRAGCRKAPPGPILMPPSMFSGTAPTPGDSGSSARRAVEISDPLVSHFGGGTHERWLCTRRIQTRDGRVSDLRIRAVDRRSPDHSRRPGNAEARRPMTSRDSTSSGSPLATRGRNTHR